MAIKADKVKGTTWNAATQAERDAATRRIYWELQRTYFEAYRKAAQQAKREAKAAIDKFAGNVAARQKLNNAELAEEATDVMPVAGRLPQNHDYAGQAFPTDLLPAKYRSKGLRFTKEDTRTSRRTPGNCRTARTTSRSSTPARAGRTRPPPT